jgi:hypothetical protein
VFDLCCKESSSVILQQQQAASVMQSVPLFNLLLSCHTAIGFDSFTISRFSPLFCFPSPLRFIHFSGRTLLDRF